MSTTKPPVKAPAAADRKPPVKSAAPDRKPTAKSVVKPAPAKPTAPATKPSPAVVAAVQAPVQAAAHPTRIAPLCVACAHCVRTSSEQFSPLCQSPRAPVDLVYGAPPATKDMRDAVVHCGPQGAWFTPA